VLLPDTIVHPIESALQIGELSFDVAGRDAEGRSHELRPFEHSVKLMSAHPPLACAEKVVSQQPFAQGNFAVFKDRANGHGELFPGSGTLSYLDDLGFTGCGKRPAFK
jgi:hypothetical protein